jgi:uroporphyrin-3 C-methyltransferase
MDVPETLESQPILEKLMQTRVRNLMAQPAIAQPAAEQPAAAAPVTEQPAAPQGE